MHEKLKLMLRPAIVTALVLISALVTSAGMTASFTSLPLRKAFKEIERVSELHFLYKENLPGLDQKVSLTLNNASEKSVLDQLFKGTPLTYKIQNKNTVVVYERKAKQEADAKDKTTMSIAGTVIDETGEPLIGASVMVKGTSVGAVTDLEGHYELKSVPKGAQVDVSYVGYTGKSAKITNTGNYDFKLLPNAQVLQEMVVVGYGTQKKVNLTGAVSVVDSKEIGGRPTGNAATALQGVDPALNLAIGSGSPNSSANLDIRGTTSINGGKPLVLVDGVEMDLTRVNANDIESVSVLKDASASAIYGAKASAGVVLVTTKSGQNESKPTITVDLKAGWRNPTVSNDYITTGFWSAYINDLFYYEHAGRNYTSYDDQDMAQLWMRVDQPVETEERPWAVPDSRSSYYKYFANTDWHDHFFRKSRPMQDYNLSLSGGSKKINYYVSGRAYLEDGMIRQNNDKFKSFSLRAKLNAELTSWLTYRFNTSFFKSDYDYPGTNSTSDIFKYACQHGLAFLPSLNPDGTSVAYNPHTTTTARFGMNALLNYGKHKNEQDTNDFMVKNSFEIKPFKWWTIFADYAYSFRNMEYRGRRVNVPYSNIPGVVEIMGGEDWAPLKDQLTRTMENHSRQTINVYTTFNPSFGNHNFQATLGMNAEIYHSRRFKAVRLDLMSEEVNSLNVATGIVDELTDTRNNAVTQGYFARVNYDYDGRYLIEVSGRYDGSSRFHKDHRWGFFPSASAGWRISEEKFWDALAPVWNNAKLRLSYGSLGNQQVGYYDYIQTLSSTGTIDKLTFDGTNRVPYAVEGSPVAGDLTWEKVITYNVGLDLGFFNNRLQLSGDMYIRDTKDMLTSGADLPAVYGAKVPRSNCADLRTRGWELGVTWRDNFTLLNSPFTYTIGAGIGDHTTEITKFDNQSRKLGTHYVGEKLGEIWGYDIDGLFASDEEAAAYTPDVSLVCSDILNAGPVRGLHAGDVRYVDRNHDGIISPGENTVDNPGDMFIIGNTTPRYNYNFRGSFEWKGIDFSIFFQGVGKRDWYPGNEANTFWGPYGRCYQSFIPSDFMNQVWSEDNPDAYFPRYRGYEGRSSNSMGKKNTRYLQNLAYLRLKSLSIGYTLPVLKNVFESIRIYFAAENLAYWSPFKKHCSSIDPENAMTAADDTANDYGFAKTFTFGLNIVF